MATWPILSVTTFLPLVGALFILLLRGDDEAAKRNARWVALWTTVITFVVSVFLITGSGSGQSRISVCRGSAVAWRKYPLQARC